VSLEWLQPISKEQFEIKYQFHRSSPEEVIRDVATVISEVEKPEKREAIKEKFYEMMVNRRFIPGGRILANAWPGTPVKNYINCFTVGTEDDMTSIYNTLAEDAKISKVGGGVGLDISPLRPKGSPLSVGGEASGPLSFLKIFDASAKIIMTGGSRRCLPKGAWINTRYGMKKIEEIEIGEEVLTSDGYAKTSGKFEQGEQETIKIITQDGEFECTPNHKMPVFDSCFTYTWKEAKDLKKGDKLVWVAQTIEGKDTRLPPFEYIKPLSSTTCKDITIPQLDADIAWLFGLIHGDGCVRLIGAGKGKLTIDCDPKYPEIVERAKNIISKFGIDATVRKRFGKKSITGSIVIKVHSKQLALFLSQFKIPNSDISIPSFIMEGRQEIRAAYLAGLFDSDGSARNRSIKAVCTIYPNFKNDIVALYSSLSIPVRVIAKRSRKNNWRDKYLVKIVGSTSRECFDRFIAPHSQKFIYRIRDTKSAFYGKSKHDHNFPMMFFKNIELRKKDRLANVCTKNKNITFSTLSRVLDKKLNLIPIDFIKIVPGRKIETFDLEVENKHEFVSSGYLTHNSAHIALLDVSHPDIEEFITCKQGDKNRELTQFNISVKVTDKFMKAVDEDKDWNLTWGGDVYKTVRARHLWDMIAKNAYKNNEPGIFNVDTINRYNNGWWMYEIHQCNPCITGDTLIAVADGRNAVPIKQLAEESNDIPVYAKDGDGKTVIRMMRNPRITGHNKKILKVYLDDGTTVRCTENHKFMLNDGFYKEAKDLNVGDSLKRFDSYISNKKYRQIKSGTGRDRQQYRMIAEHFGLIGNPKTEAIHHYDFDLLNDLPENLVAMDRNEHHELHSERMKGDNNPMRKYSERNWMNNPDAQQATRKKHHIGANRSDETKARMKEVMAGNNHQVSSIELDGHEDVYNGTVDDYHNYAIVTSSNDEKFITTSGVFIKNCGEQMLEKYGVCCLGAMNLTAYVVNPFSSEAYFDFTKLERDVALAVRFLDNVLDAAEYPLEKITEQVQSLRRIGLGFMGLGDVFAMMRMVYGDKKSRHLSKEIAQLLRDCSYMTSASLAQEKGSFPLCDNDKLLQSNFIQKLPDIIKTEIKKHGLRNIALNTVAPTGTTALTLGMNCSSGIEPIFSLEYQRNIRTKSNPDEYITQEVFDYAWGMWKLFRSERPIKIPEFFVTTKDIAPKDSIDIQAIFQEYIDAAISKTLNLRPGTTFEEYKDLFSYAYKKELKGFTTFNPDGSMRGILEYNVPFKNGKNNSNGYIKRRIAPPRERDLPCDIHKTTIKGKKIVVLVGKLKGSLYEIFVDDDSNGSLDLDKIGKNGIIRKVGSNKYNLIVQNGEEKVVVENLSKNFGGTYGSLARFVSMSLRHGTPLQFIVDQLTKSKEFVGFERSVSRVLKKYIKDGEKVITGDVCPECEGELEFKDGCVFCPNCAWSKCL
jgi:ribonucleotide reductase alpha subunit